MLKPLFTNKNNRHLEIWPPSWSHSIRNSISRISHPVNIYLELKSDVHDNGEPTIVGHLERHLE